MEGGPRGRGRGSTLPAWMSQQAPSGEAPEGLMGMVGDVINQAAANARAAEGRGGPSHPRPPQAWRQQVPETLPRRDSYQGPAGRSSYAETLPRSYGRAEGGPTGGRPPPSGFGRQPRPEPAYSGANLGPVQPRRYDEPPGRAHPIETLPRGPQVEMPLPRDQYRGPRLVDDDSPSGKAPVVSDRTTARPPRPLDDDPRPVYPSSGRGDTTNGALPPGDDAAQRPSKVRRQESASTVGADGDPDLEDEQRWRDQLRRVQNEGYDAYQAQDYERARDKFEDALEDHAKRCKHNTTHFQRSGNRVPSRVHADRDQARSKLLRYLGRTLDKLGDEEAMQARYEEAQTIDNRLKDYQNRKKASKEAHRRH